MKSHYLIGYHISFLVSSLTSSLTLACIYPSREEILEAVLIKHPIVGTEDVTILSITKMNEYEYNIFYGVP